MSTSFTVVVPTGSGDVPLTFDERGTGRPVVLLHGGAGPVSVAGFADLLAAGTGSRVIVPTHPGFNGTPRPEPLVSVAGLAEVYAGLLDVLALEDAVMVGNSLGGWITAETALRRPARLSRIALVDAVGADVPGHPVVDFFALAPAQVAEHSWYDPSNAPSLDPAALPPAAQQVLAANRAALALYGGTMSDATLIGRLAEVAIPTLVIWGEADRIVDVEHGRAYAEAVPGARLAVLPRTGHVPQMETPDALLEVLRGFLTE